MDDLVQFLRARLDEDARIARRASSYDDGASHDVEGPEGTWACLDETEWFGPSYRGGVIAPRIGQVNAPELGAHIVRHDPARVLADIDAKRELLKRGDTLFCDCDFADSPPTNPEDRSQEIPHHYDCTAYRVAAVLALPYADHPDYREEWRP